MSHFTKIATKIKDKEALKAAVSNMGFSLLENSKARYYYGTQTADMVVKLPCRYDVALNNENGEEYSIEADMYGGYVKEYVGEGAGLLLQQYAVEKVKIEAFKNALSVTQRECKNNIVLNLIDPDQGGQIEVTCFPNGKTEVKTVGFPGESCMRFKSIEEALGSTESIEPTMEMYQEDENNEHIFISVQNSD